MVLGEVGRRYLEMIENRARETSKLVEDLLSFSKTGRDDLRISRVGLNEMVDEVKASLKNDYDGRQVEWKIGPLPQVSADPALLRMALVNLLSNGLKYSRNRERAELEVGARSTESEDTIFVRDNGVGFDMKHAGKLFGIFQRLHDRKQFEGNGIGLANVQRIILRHGGKVWAEAQPERGATFYFSLPKRRGVAAAGTKPEA